MSQAAVFLEMLQNGALILFGFCILRLQNQVARLTANARAEDVLKGRNDGFFGGKS